MFLVLHASEGGCKNLLWGVKQPDEQSSSEDQLSIKEDRGVGAGKSNFFDVRTAILH